MNTDGKVTKPNCLARIKNKFNKFRSSNKKRPASLHENDNTPNGSTVTTSKKKDQVDQNCSTASEIRPETQAKLDLWQEALDKAQQSADWKAHKQEYDEAVLDCQANNQNILNNNSTDNEETTNFADAISNHLSLLREKALEKQWEYKRSSEGESFYFRDVITRIVKWVKVFKDPGNQLAGLDPTKAASLVWGFVQFFVERAVVYNETRDMAIDQEPIANLITRYALIEKLYIGNISGNLDEADETVRDKIVALYTAIILYQMAIYKFWKQGKITHGIQSLVPHKLKDLSSSIQEKSEKVEKALRAGDRSLQLQILETVNVKVQEPIAQIGGQLQQVLDVVENIENDRYSNVLKWVSPILYMDHHREYKPLDGTGSWILDHSDWKEWRQSQKSGLFWLRGKMGAGKSNLVPNGEERVAFFYTNSTSREGETKSAETTLRSLLKQLAIQDNRALLQPVVTKYDELRDVSSLGKEDCIGLLTDIISKYRQTSIIIDGLDELADDDVRRDVLNSLKRIMDGLQGAVVKIFISSRDHVNIGDLLDKIWTSRKEIMIGRNNYEDITKFIKTRVQELENMLSTPIPEDIKRDMESTLKERSNGM
ncbi:hypothetical protein NHQ30_007727 [Ciborinia camelliae]|nr:hypothetical protein NHQ30_007727 [Ciborinia camelliae]